MKLTKQVWDEYSQDNVLKFCIDINTKEIFFHAFDIDHFVFALAILDKNPPRTRDELFDILHELKNHIIGGQLMRQKDVLACVVGFSGLEYELTPAKLDHNPSTMDAAADICLSVINNSNLSFKTLVITKLVSGKKIEHIHINRS